MNSAGWTASLEYSRSQSVHTSWLVNTIPFCHLIASLHASLASWASSSSVAALTRKLHHFLYALNVRCFLFLPVFTAAPTQQVQGFQAALLVRGKKKKKETEKHLWRLKRAHAAASPCQRGVMKNVYGTTLTGNYLFLLEARSFIRRRKRAHRRRRKLVPTFQQGGKRRGGLGESISLTGSSNHYLAS